MKKSYILLLLIINTIILSSCGEKSDTGTINEKNTLSCSNTLIVNSINSKTLNLNAKVIAESIKNVTSNNGGTVDYINCQKGTKVTKKTLIAKIKPDYSDPNVQNLVNQSNMIISQISNTKDIINSTKANYDTQLNSLNIQKANLENQVKILSNTYDKISEQKDFGVSDIDKQLETLQIQLDTLETQITDLSKSKTKLEDSKQSDINKIISNLANTKTQAKSLVGNTLLQIDEIFGISEKNQSKNDNYENFLSAKNTSLKTDVERDWNNLNSKFLNFNDFTDDELSNYLQSLDILSSNAKDAIKDSIASTNFTQTTIDNLYSTFYQYENSIVNTKNGLDNIVKSLETVKNTYDTQILGLDTQIDGAKNSKKSTESNIDNIKSNKLGTYTTSIDLQKNQTESQVESAKTSLSTISSQIESMNSQEKIQLNQLNNQLEQLQASLNTININLNPQSYYAETDGIIKEKVGSLGNKIGPSSMICQILPDKSSLKLQVYSSYDLPLPLDIEFDVDGKKYTTKLITKLPYQDSVTQNYIYETSTYIQLDSKEINLTDIISEGKTLNISTVTNKDVKVNNKIYIPINFVSNTINGSNVKIKKSDGSIIEKDVILGELDLNNIEIRSGLNFGDEICN